MIEDLIRMETEAGAPVQTTLEVLQGVQAGCARSIEDLKKSNAAALAQFDAALARRGELLEQYRQMNVELRQGQGGAVNG